MTPLEALRVLVKRDDLRWKHRGYDQYGCSSCGAAARPNDFGVMLRKEACSPSCPWRQAEEAIALEDAEAEP